MYGKVLGALLFILSVIYPISAGAAAPFGDPPVLGGIAPHHDIAAEMITRFYDELSQKKNVKRIYLLAPDHFRRARNWAAVCGADWQAAGFGTLKAGADAVNRLRRLNVVEVRSDMFAAEHGITVHIPFIARYFKDAAVIPIVLRRDIPDTALLSIRGAIREMAGEDELIILSMDFSHYKTPEEMAEEDKRSICALTNMNIMKLARADVDARRAAALVTLLFRDRGARRGELLERSDSSEVLGRRVESGTSYATIIYREDMKK
jgi:AmmeMemoRadiSam system protein B